MKSCPKCGKTYQSDDLNYCLDDGTRLLQDVDAAAPTIAIQPSDATAGPIFDATTTPHAQIGQPYLAAPSPARSGARVWPFLIIGLAILLCGGSVGGAFLAAKLYSPASTRISEKPAPVSATPVTEKKTPERPSGESVTMANYNRLKLGMSRSDVEDILSGKGEQVSSSTGGGHTYTVDSWEGEDYRSIILTFDNDKLTAKSQAGLDL